jgi:predicted AlkP superfamily pyrophosphatase or phosphodiesterase
MKIRKLLVLAMTVAALAGRPASAQTTPAGKSAATAPQRARGAVQHVLIISADGLHAVDLARYVQANPRSVLSQLSKRGVTYTNAATPLPNSTPGMLAMWTGGTSNTTGAIYSEGYDRSLSPPNSDCSKKGTIVNVNEIVSVNPDAEDSGGGIDTRKMPRDPAKGCSPVYPHAWIKVNNIFEVVKRSGGRTAWIDQFPGFCDLTKGPSGQGLDDEYAPNAHAPGVHWAIPKSIAQDDLRMKAFLNNVAGKDHTGARDLGGTPTLAGVTLITVNVAQKIVGYADGDATPTPGITESMDYLDREVGKVVEALKARNAYDSTMIIVTAKHGNSPIDIKKKRIISETEFCGQVNEVQKGLLGQCSVDSIALIWLTDQSKTADVVARYRANQDKFGIHKVYSGETLKMYWNDPKVDPRTPDIIVQPVLGVYWSRVDNPKLAEHGGFFDEDTNVALMLSWPGGKGETIRTPVQTTQVAPTILRALGLNPGDLKAVRMERTAVLPGMNLAP